MNSGWKKRFQSQQYALAITGTPQCPKFETWHMDFEYDKKLKSIRVMALTTVTQKLRSNVIIIEL